MADSHAYEAPLRVREFLLVSPSTRLLARWFCIAITSGRDVAILLLGFLHYYFNFRERQSHARREGDRRWKHQSKLDNSGVRAVFRQRGVSGVHLISIAGATRRRYCLLGKLLHARHSAPLRGIHGIGAR